MAQRRSNRKLLCVAGFMFLLVSLNTTDPTFASTDRSDMFSPLKKKLETDGFKKTEIEQLYSHPSVAFDAKGVSMYFIHNEGKLNYDQFAEKKSVDKALNYLKKHKSALDEAQKKYGVDKEVIVAILLVESRLGTYTGNRRVLNTLSTMAALQDKTIRKEYWNYIASSTHLSRKEYETKAKRKSGWAYKELKAFLQYTSQEKIDPGTIKGSYAGALGYCQFMPSNILILARDGNNDKKINLFDHEDAIMSIASYLSHYGWKPGIPPKTAAKVVYTYNHSSYYVNIILKVASILKKSS